MSETPDFAPYPPEPQLPATQPPRMAAPGHRVARASGVQTRVEGRGSSTSTVTVLTFRIVDPDGGQPAEVELRGPTLAGSVRDGDWLDLVDQRAKSGRYELDRVSNLTTGSEVTVAGILPNSMSRVFLTLFILVFVTVLIIIIVGAMSLNSQF